MKKMANNIAIEELTKDYLELGSAYKVASKHNVSATAVKRLLKQARVLRTQSEAASIRNQTTMAGIVGKYERTEAHKEAISNHAKTRTGDNNPFYGKTHSEESKAKIGHSSKERTGKRNPNYKDGKYIRRPRDYKIAEFTRIRKDVFNRDSHTCQLCSTKGGHLHAHHKLPYWVKPEAFLDKDNLITVCAKCHFEKAHQSNWAAFDMTLVEDSLILKYSLDRERLNEMAVTKK
jgi:5-methylcytosine-specific restriction endonuclease McrA